MNRGLGIPRRLLLNRARPDRSIRIAAPAATAIAASSMQAQRRHYVLDSNESNSGTTTWRKVAADGGNVLIIGSVMALFGYIMYTLYDNLLAENGTTRVYNDSLDLIRANPQIRSLLGTSVLGFGEPTHSQRQRHRSIAHREFVDEQGRRRLSMQYYIRDSAYAIPYLGVVKLDLAQNTSAWDYNYIVVDVYPIDRSSFGDDWMQRTESAGSPMGRVEVLVTDEFAAQVRNYKKQKRNEKFSAAGKGSHDGSWFSVLHPGNWRKCN
ncbi:mitochondrial import inner membrane translocase subunit tim21 [Coemansia sp. RSA 2399]|nr:mitochondrial import inner membrane translocase subunit tim21 [Coemansia sp. RSA 2399]